MNVRRSCENVLGGNCKKGLDVGPATACQWSVLYLLQRHCGDQWLSQPPCLSPWEGDLQREQWGHRALFENSSVYPQRSCVVCTSTYPPPPPPRHCSHFSSCKHLFSFKKLLADGWWGCSQVIVAKPAPGLVHYWVIMALHLLVCYSIIVLFSESAYWPE